MHGIGCLTSIDIVLAGVGCSSSEDRESSSEETTCKSGDEGADTVAVDLVGLAAVWCVRSCVEPDELVDCVAWGSFDRTFGGIEGRKVGYVGFGQAGSTCLLGESLVFLCLLDVEFGWRSLLSFLEGRLVSSLTLSPRSLDILEFGRR
jgi:hypothetical protein